MHMGPAAEPSCGFGASSRRSARKSKAHRFARPGVERLHTLSGALCLTCPANSDVPPTTSKKQASVLLCSNFWLPVDIPGDATLVQIMFMRWCGCLSG